MHGRRLALGQAWYSSTQVLFIRDHLSQKKSTRGWLQFWNAKDTARLMKLSAAAQKTLRGERLSSNKLIVALDVDNAQQARELVSALRECVGLFKIGMQLFTAAGPSLVREIVKAGGRVFLDLKYHDIPNTVAAAGVEAARLGVSIFNVHASGGSEMMRRTADAVMTVSEREGLTRPRVI